MVFNVLKCPEYFLVSDEKAAQYKMQRSLIRKIIITQSAAGAVKYTDCISADELENLLNKCPGYDT